jgi:tripartite-type tricarboxylate transporter receptor subunit TctC
MANLVMCWKGLQQTLIGVMLPASFAGAALIIPDTSFAQPYPGKVIKIVVPLVAGGPPDAMARLLAPALSSRMGTTVIVENRPGGGGTIGTKAVASAPPDGYTLLFSGANHTQAPAVSKTLDYDPIKDFVPIATVGWGSWLLVVPSSGPARSVKELIEYAKANPGKLNWGFGLNAGPHLFGELFVAATGIQVAKISYKGGQQVIPDILGSRIDMNFGTTGTLLPLIRDGRLRALAVTSEIRSPDLPDVPTMSESGLPQLTRGFWTGLLAPAGTPTEIVSKLNAEINIILATPDMRANLLKQGYEPKAGSPQDFAMLLADEIDIWSKAAKAAGIVPQ